MKFIKDIKDYSEFIERLGNVEERTVIFIEYDFFPWKFEVFPGFLRYFSSQAKGGILPCGFFSVVVYWGRSMEENREVWVIPLGTIHLLRAWGKVLDRFIEEASGFSVRKVWESDTRTEFVSLLRSIGLSAEEISFFWKKRKQVIWMDERMERNKIMARRLKNVFDHIIEDDWVLFSLGIEEMNGVSSFLRALENKRVCIKEPLHFFPVLLRLFLRESRGKKKESEWSLKRRFWKGVERINWISCNYLKFLSEGQKKEVEIDWFDFSKSKCSIELYPDRYERHVRGEGRGVVRDVESYWCQVFRKSLLQREYEEILKGIESKKNEKVFVWKGGYFWANFLEWVKKGHRFYKEFIFEPLCEMRLEGVDLDAVRLREYLEGLESEARKVAGENVWDGDEGGGAGGEVEKLKKRYEILLDVYKWFFVVDEEQGRYKVFPVYDIYATRTGRVVTRCPSIFRLSEEVVRDVVKSLGFDFSQMELRVGVSVFGIRDVVEFLRDGDFYEVLGEGDRSRGKILCFKILYGEKERENSFKIGNDKVRFFKVAVERVKSVVERYLPNVKYVGTYTGRVRMLEESEKSVPVVMNTFIQGTSSDLVFAVAKNLIRVFSGVRLQNINQDCLYLRFEGDGSDLRDKILSYLSEGMRRLTGVPFRLKVKNSNKI